MKHASIFLRDARLFFVPMKEATTGALLDGLPIEVANIDDDEAIKQKFEITLARFQSGVPHPDFRGWSIDESPVVKVAGCRSW